MKKNKNVTSLIFNKKCKILIVQLRQLGDVILTTPLTRQVRKIFPDAEIHFLTENLGGQVYLYNKNINKLIIYPRKIKSYELFYFYYKLYRERYDLIVDSFCNPKSAQFSFFSRAKERIGFEFLGRQYAYTKLIKQNLNNEYSAITKLRLIDHLGADLKDNEIELPITSQLKKYAENFFEKYFKTNKKDTTIYSLEDPKKLDENKKVIAFNVVSRRNYKVWDIKQFAILANYLIDKGYYLFFTYGPGEYDMAKKVYDELHKKYCALIDYSIPNIPELKAILERCKMYIGNDGGIKHLAVCANIPTFTIFQNINWANWTPPNSSKHIAVTNCLEKKDFCKNCTDNSKCFINLSAEDVIKLIRVQQPNVLD
jgi:heptosyltransferase III